MAQWVAFATIVTLLTAVMILLSHRTQRSITPVDADRPPGIETTVPSRSAETERTTRSDAKAEPSPTADGDIDGETLAPARGQQELDTVDRIDDTIGPSAPAQRATTSDRIVARAGGRPITSRGLLLNVLATHGLFLAVVAGTIILTGVPADVLGIAFTRPALVTGLGVGLGAGFGLYAASELGSAIGRRVGVVYDEWLRESLAPSRPGDWIVLFAVVLPVIAIFEELLFRAVLVGAFSAGFGLSPWLLAVGSSVLFALGHGIQGTAGIVVTGVVGFVLAATFIVTESLLAVVVAHYVLNGCEFAVYEYFEFGSPGA